MPSRRMLALFFMALLFAFSVLAVMAEYQWPL